MQGTLNLDPIADALRALGDEVDAELGYQSQIFRNFVRYHNEHPDVLRLLVWFSEDIRRRGRVRYSINAVFERVRWHVDIETTESTTGLRLNNNYRAYYARLLLRLHPNLGPLFAVRSLGQNHQIV